MNALGKLAEMKAAEFLEKKKYSLVSKDLGLIIETLQERYLQPETLPSGRQSLNEV